MMVMYEKGKQELSNIWEAIDSVKVAAQASDAIKTAAGTPENANMVKAIEESRALNTPVQLEAGIFDDTTADMTVANLSAEEIEPVVEVDSNSSIIDKVEDVFPSNGILSEIAQAESLTGEHPDTYREGYFGGMMQVDEIGFEDTQDVKSHPKLKKHYDKIKKEFGKDWPSMTWEDMTDPLNSVIAARLKLLNVDDPIPTTQSERAAYWKKHYNTVKGKGTVSHFKDANK